MAAGQLFVLSGPSGVGKGVICERLLAYRPSLQISVSLTTRRPRPGERSGCDYDLPRWTGFRSSFPGMLFWNGLSCTGITTER